MARRADWDVDDDDFEVLDVVPHMHMHTPQTFEVNEGDESYEIVSNTSQPVDAKLTTVENVNPINRSYVRYGSAAAIPYQNAFDYKSILGSKPVLPSNDIMALLRDAHSAKRPSVDNHLAELLSDSARDREQLLRIAKERQQELIKAMRLD